MKVCSIYLPHFIKESISSMFRFTSQLLQDMFLLRWFSVYPHSWRRATLHTKMLYPLRCWTSSRTALISSMNFAIFSLPSVSIPPYRCLASMHWSTIIILFNFSVRPMDCVLLSQSQSCQGTLAAIQSLQGFITDADYSYAHGEDVHALP